MEIKTKYSQIIKSKLNEIAQSSIANLPDLKTELIIDKNKNHYILLDMGWQDNEFIHEWVFHIEIKNDKVWVHEDMTDVNIAQELIDAGINASDIRISAWQMPGESMSNQDAA